MASHSKEEWEEKTLAPAVSRFPERQERFQTESGIEQDVVYGPQDLEAAGFDYQRDLSYPGEYPYTRGVQPSMYRGRVWTMRQYSGYASARKSNRRFHYLLEQGQTGLSIAFDLPTQVGYDSDHPLAQGEVGKVGVSICSLRDMEVPPGWDSAGQSQHLHDDQLHSFYSPLPIHSRRQEAGRAPGEGQRHYPERHPQGVHS